MDRYKNNDALYYDIEKLSDFGECDVATGEFIFSLCPHCKGPRLGHKDREETCKNKLEAGDARVLNSKKVEQIKTR